MSRYLLAALSFMALAAPAIADPQPDLDSASLQASEVMQVQVSGVTPGGEIPIKYTRYGHNVSPAMSWRAVPGARGYVVVMRDLDVPAADAPGVHWLVYDIPAPVLALPGSMRNVDAPDKPLGAAQGWNLHASLGYTGPHPPVGDPPHHYDFEVFALGRALHLRPGAHIDWVLAAMRGQVVARGQVQATFTAPNPVKSSLTPQ